MTKINWERERLKSFLEEKGYKFKHQIGSITFKSYIYENKSNGKRLEVWDDNSGELTVVDVNSKLVDLEKL